MRISQSQAQHFTCRHEWINFYSHMARLLVIFLLHPDLDKQYSKGKEQDYNSESTKKGSATSSLKKSYRSQIYVKYQFMILLTKIEILILEHCDIDL